MTTKHTNHTKPPFEIVYFLGFWYVYLHYGKNVKYWIGKFRSREKAKQAALDIVLAIANHMKPTRKRVEWVIYSEPTNS